MSGLSLARKPAVMPAAAPQRCCGGEGCRYDAAILRYKCHAQAVANTQHWPLSAKHESAGLSHWMPTWP